MILWFPSNGYKSKSTSRFQDGQTHWNGAVRPNWCLPPEARGWSAWLLCSCAAFLAINSAERDGGITALQAAGGFLVFAWRVHQEKLFPEVSKPREQCLVNRHPVPLAELLYWGNVTWLCEILLLPGKHTLWAWGRRERASQTSSPSGTCLKKGQGGVFKFPFLFLVVGWTCPGP